jgi:hypothetical protein
MHTNSHAALVYTNWNFFVNYEGQFYFDKIFQQEIVQVIGKISIEKSCYQFIVIVW